MIFIFGSRMYGKVDQVPGLFHVATQFAHVQFIPLVPIKSWLVIDSTVQGGRFRGVPLGWHGRSIFFAWLRFGSCIGGLLCVVLAVIFGGDALNGRMDMMPAAVVCAVLAPLLFVLFGLSYKLSKAGPTRALAHAKRCGIPPEVVAQFFADRLGPEEEEALTRRVESERDYRDQDPPVVEPVD
jgi:hypothetical protein